MSSAAPRDAAAFEVLEALGESGCAVCRLTLRSVGRLLQTISYEQVNDPALRAELRKARGFCNAHAHQWLRESRGVLGTALIYRDLLQATLSDLEDRSPSRGRSAPCVACRAQTDAERRYVEALVAAVASDSAALEASDGVCRRHTLAARRSGGGGAAAVVERTRRAIEALTRELDEVIRKEDYRFRHEPRTDAERSAPARAVALVASAAGITPELDGR